MTDRPIAAVLVARGRDRVRRRVLRGGGDAPEPGGGGRERLPRARRPRTPPRRMSVATLVARRSRGSPRCRRCTCPRTQAGEEEGEEGSEAARPARPSRAAPVRRRARRRRVAPPRAPRVVTPPAPQRAGRASARASTPRDDPAATRTALRGRACGGWPSDSPSRSSPRSAAGSSPTGSPPIRRRRRRRSPQLLDAGAARLRVSLGVAGSAEAARLPGLHGRAGVDALRRASAPRSRSRSSRPTTRRSCPPPWSRRPTAGCPGRRRRASSGSRRAPTAASRPATASWTSTPSPPRGAC